MKACYTYGLFAALFTLSACIPNINIGDKCATDSQCGLFQCHPDGYCTQPCNTSAQCPSGDYLCTQGMCQTGAGLSYECQNASECASQPCATAQCDDGYCLYNNVLCDEPPTDYCNEADTHYIQYSAGVCDTETNSCIYQAIETECLGGCLETCHETCKDTNCAQNNNQCLENCVCDPQSDEGECICSEKVHDGVQTPQCMLSDESAQSDGYCLEGDCVGCINDPQCATSQTDACIVSECHPTEHFCLDIVEPPDSASVTEGTTHWTLEACAELTPDDCWAPTCALNSTDSALNGCLQNFLPRTDEPCTALDGQSNACLEDNGSCDETGACILDAKTDGTDCTASGTGECSIANATCDNGSCEQNPTHLSADAPCTDTDTNECNIAKCDGAGDCNQNADNVATGTPCKDTDTNECNIAQCNGAGTCDQNADNVATGTICTDTNTNDCKVAQCDGAGDCDQNADNVVNGTACNMFLNQSNESSEPPSTNPEALTGVCDNGTCIADDGSNPMECVANADCEETEATPYCCTAQALAENDDDCGAKNKNSCVACLNDHQCTRIDQDCCKGICQLNTLTCTKSTGGGEK